MSPAGQMMSVYGRVFVLHATVLGGAFLAGAFGTPFAALVLLVALKTAADLFFHLRQHRRASVAAKDRCQPDWPCDRRRAEYRVRRSNG